MPIIPWSFGKSDSFRQHGDHLETSCITAVNLLKYLLRLSGGADSKMLLLPLYSAINRIKGDYVQVLQFPGIPKSKILHS